MWRNPFRRRRELSDELVNWLLQEWIGSPSLTDESKKRIEAALAISKVLTLSLHAGTISYGSIDDAWKAQRSVLIGYVMGFVTRLVNELGEKSWAATPFVSMSTLCQVLERSWNEDEVVAEWDRLRKSDPMDPTFHAGIQAGLDEAIALSEGRPSTALMELLTRLKLA